MGELGKLLPGGGSTKIKTGSFNIETKSAVATVNLGWKPDLVICYAEENRNGYVAIHDGYQANCAMIPKIFSGADAESSEGITDSGFKFSCFSTSASSNMTFKVYYFAVKF